MREHLGQRGVRLGMPYDLDHLTYHIVLLTNDTTQIRRIGPSTSNESIVILYSATRDDLQGIGEITILCPFTDYVEPEPAHTNYFDELGLSFTAELDGTNIVLNCIVDDSSVDDITFNYQI